MSRGPTAADRVRMVLRYHPRLDDEQIGWACQRLFGLKPSTAKNARGKLTRLGIVRRAALREKTNGKAVKLWELK